MLKELQRKFGDLAGAQSGYDCLSNAVHNTALAVYGGGRSQILFVETNVGPHAYLTDGRNAYSKGLTWTTDYYPELSLRQIFELKGLDVTTIMFWQALEITEDVHGYHRVLDRLDNRMSGIKTEIARLYGL